MKEAEKEYKEAMDNMPGARTMERQLEINQLLTETMMKLAKFEAEGATPAQILGVLSEGLKAFMQLKEQ